MAEEKKYYSIEEICVKLQLFGAKYWEVWNIGGTESAYTSSRVQTNDLKNWSFDDEIEKFRNFMCDNNGRYKIKYYNNACGNREEPNILYMQIGETNKSCANHSSADVDISSITGAIREELRSEYRSQADEQINNYKEILQRENELYKLNRDLEDYKRKISQLEDENRTLSKENSELTKKIADDNLNKVERFIGMAEPYLKIFLASRGGGAPASVQGTSQPLQQHGAGEGDFNLNIPDDRSERFINAINEWAQYEDKITELIERFVYLKKNKPNIYDMALSYLLKE